MSKINRINIHNIYIDSNPECKKWINECICCHKKGYNPSMPEKITLNEIGFTGAEYIRQNYKPLLLNEYGLCEICAKLNNKDK